MSQRELGGQVGVALHQGGGEHLAERLLEGLAIDPESLVVVTLAEGKGHQRHLPAAGHRGILGGVIKGSLLVAHVVFGAALE